MAITPSPFMFLEADADKGLLHFVASTPDGQAQIAGAGNLWAVAVIQAEGTYTFGRVRNTPGGGGCSSRAGGADAVCRSGVVLRLAGADGPPEAG